MIKLLVFWTKIHNLMSFDYQLTSTVIDLADAFCVPLNFRRQKLLNQLFNCHVTVN